MVFVLPLLPSCPNKFHVPTTSLVPLPPSSPSQRHRAEPKLPWAGQGLYPYTLLLKLKSMDRNDHSNGVRPNTGSKTAACKQDTRAKNKTKAPPSKLDTAVLMPKEHNVVTWRNIMAFTFMIFAFVLFTLYATGDGAMAPDGPPRGVRSAFEDAVAIVQPKPLVHATMGLEDTFREPGALATASRSATDGLVLATMPQASHTGDHYPAAIPRPHLNTDDQPISASDSAAEIAGEATNSYFFSCSVSCFSASVS